MEPTDVDEVRATLRVREARRAYELGRLRTALLGASPVLGLIAASAWLGAGTFGVAVGAALFAFAAGALFHGRTAGEGVVPGLAVGIVPFVIIHAAQPLGHVCAMGSCYSWCMPACAASGLIAGALVARTTLRRGMAAFGVGTIIVLAEGAMGCRCIGFGSIAGMLLGLALASTPELVRVVRARA